MKRGAGGGRPAPPRRRRVRVERLFTVKAVLLELSKVYGEGRRGTLPWSDVTRAAYTLRVAGELLGAYQLEERISEIEAARQAAPEASRVIETTAEDGDADLSQSNVAEAP